MFGEHEAAGAIPVIPTIVVGRSISLIELVTRGRSAPCPRVAGLLFMPSLRGTRHDSAKIDGGGSNPPGGTHVSLRRGLVTRLDSKSDRAGFNS